MFLVLLPPLGEAYLLTKNTISAFAGGFMYQTSIVNNDFENAV